MAESRRVPPELGGARLDRVLASWSSIGSREKARQALKSGKVSVDGRDAGPDDAGATVPEGAEVVVDWTRAGTSRRATAGKEALVRADVRVLHHDADLVVVDKPSGLLTDAADRDQARFRDTLAKRVRALVDGTAWPVHRIDRDTTGVVAFARTEAAHEHLKAQWASQSPERVYVAIAEGVFPADEGEFADWMVWDAAQKIQRRSRPGATDAVLARAFYRVIERLPRATALEVRLVTGRRNQIRLHAALAGHPLIGDGLYRHGIPPLLRFPRQALHAARLGLVHPTSGRPLTFESPLPSDLVDLLRTLRRMPAEAEEERGPPRSSPRRRRP